jgi:4'-phosphopantetheinyl transferase
VTAIDVWSVDLDASPWFEPSLLPADERRRAARLRHPRDRSRWIAARTALRLILGRYLGQDPAQIELRVGGHGKPALADRERPLRFNMSHSGDLALVAVTPDLEVGVDVEERKADRDFPRLAELGLSASDATAVRSASPTRRAGAFYAAWVRREAIAKCLGVGLGPPPPRTAAVSVCPLDVGHGYAAALAVAGTEAPPVRQRTLAPA